MRNRSPLKDFVFKALLAADSGFALFEEIYADSRKFAKYGPSDKAHRSTLYSIVSRLSKKGLIEKNFDDNKLIISLTSAGRDWISKWGNMEDEKWDGVWRVVVFDIPESHRKVRDVLRGRLKSWGFVQWQKSVWASKKNLTGEIRKLVLNLGISDWVLVIESSNAGR